MKRFFQKIFILLLCLICFSSCATTKIITDINEYGNFPPEHSSMYIEDRIIFPESLENVKEAKEYKFAYDDIWLGRTQLFLDVIYDDENFQKEIERLTNFEYSWGTTKNKFLFDKKMKLFNYPTYIAIYRGERYSYASIIEEEKRIVYVFLEEPFYDSTREEILVPKIFLPKEYQFIHSGYDYKISYHIGTDYSEVLKDYFESIERYLDE